VRELEQSWRSLVEDASEPTVCVDLTGVTYIDAAGKARLAEMHEQGAQFIAGDCLTKAIVAEIVGDE
jgi:anti-anti-sigma regulatory factor